MRSWGKFAKSSAKTDKVPLPISLRGYAVTAECAGVDMGEGDEWIHVALKKKHKVADL
jgi:hypothetical protein